MRLAFVIMRQLFGNGRQSYVSRAIHLTALRQPAVGLLGLKTVVCSLFPIYDLQRDFSLWI
jgi:hypothetical protein